MTRPGNWQDAVAEVTKFYGWGPRDAWSLTWTELSWWVDQANRMIERD